MAIAAYFINSPVANGKAPNLLFSDVYQGTLQNPIINLVDSILSLPQSGFTFPKRISQLKTYDFFPFAAGTVGVFTEAFAAVTPVIGKVYKWQLITGDGTYNQSGIAIATTTSPSDLATAVNASMTSSNGGTYFTNTVVGSTITITETSPNTKGITIIFSDTNAVYAVTTPNTPAFGTLSQVQLYKPSVVAGTFDLHQFALQIDDEAFKGTTDSALRLELVQIWIDLAATGYATATTQMKQFGSGGTFWSATYSTAQMGQQMNLPK